MDHDASTRNTPRSTSRTFISILLVCVLLAGVAGIAFIRLTLQPRHIVTGTIRIAPVVRSVLTGEAQPTEEIQDYAQFVNTQAILLMSNEQRLGKIVDDLAGRNLAFFSGKPRARTGKLTAGDAPGDVIAMPDQILREAITNGDISAAYLPNTELMAVTMKSHNLDEAKTIVNSFLRNYVGQYGVDATTNESQNITILENQRNEIQKRVLEARGKIRELADEYGTTALDARREMEKSRQSMLQSERMRLEAAKIKIEADIDAYEKSERLEMAPEQLVQARTTHINSDPLIKELSAKIVQMEVDLIVAKQTGPSADPADTQQEAVFKAFQKRLEEKRLTLAEEFDRGLESRFKEAALQRVIAAKAEKAQIEAHIDGFQRVLRDQEVRTVKVGSTHLDVQDLQRRLMMDEQVLDQVNRRLNWFETERDRRPRVQIASLAEIKGMEDPRWRWTLITLGATVVLSAILLIIRRVIRPRPKTHDGA